MLEKKDCGMGEKGNERIPGAIVTASKAAENLAAKMAGGREMCFGQRCH